jgi:nicotinate-nucleotide pyrophosphorylase (carboxylating)
MHTLILDNQIEDLIAAALQEDLAGLGDLTSELLIPATAMGKGKIVVKSAGIIAGLTVAQRVFKKVDSKIQIDCKIEDGARVAPFDEILTIHGSIRGILTGERTALNFLQRLSGIATLTAKFAERIAGTNAKILDTRKTTPGLRNLEKYAVRVGGGRNHRMGLFDMILLKENHIAAAGTITEVVGKIRRELQSQKMSIAIEVETQNLEQVEEAVNARVDRIMLDNMSLPQIREAVALVNRRVEVEVSGGVTLDSVREIAETGVDYISVGALTHSAKALDLSLLLE